MKLEKIFTGAVAIAGIGFALFLLVHPVSASARPDVVSAHKTISGVGSGS